MKMKIDIALSIGIAALLLLCPPLTNAQASKSKSKAKTSASRSKAKSAKVAPPTDKIALEEAAKISNNVLKGEPTEEEMKQAVIRTMQRRGATKKDDESVSVDNALAGSSIKIEEFEKLGCQRANYGAGYFCTYGISTSITMYSNEGTSAGDKHASAVNSLIGLLNGGSNSFYETVTSRFMRSKNGWLMSKD